MCAPKITFLASSSTPQQDEIQRTRTLIIAAYGHLRRLEHQLTREGRDEFQRRLDDASRQLELVVAFSL